MNPKLMITAADMKLHGCHNCVLLAVEKCPHNIQAGQEYEVWDNSGESPVCIKGYCPEYFEFILSFADSHDTASMMWEKFYLTIPKMTGLKDNLECARLKRQIDELRIMNPQSGLLPELQTRYDYLKLWTNQLALNIAKAQARISDRESRQLDLHAPKKITIQQFNLMMKESTRLLEKDKDG